MTKESFAEIMERFQKQNEVADERLNKMYDAFGADCIEAFCDISFETIVIDAFVAGFPESKAESVRTDIEYLIYECNFNLADFQDRVWITTADGEEKHPIVTTYEDFYDYLMSEVDWEELIEWQ